MTRKLLTLFAGAAALIVGPAQAQHRSNARLSPEAQLERALEGRVAGEPVDCVNLRNVRSQQVIPGTAILYNTGNVIYVNRPRSGAESLNRWDAQVVRPFNSRLCSIDTIRVVDPTNGIMSGIVFLGEFVPYSRVRN